MRTILLLAILICMGMSSKVVYSQDSDRYNVGFNMGYAYASSHFLQLEAIYGKNYGNIHVSSIGYGMGTDLGYVKDKFVAAPKAFVEYNPFVLLSTRAGLINYISEGRNDFRLLPEAGISLVGYGNLMYGYSIPLLKSGIHSISKHRLGLNLNLYRSK